MFQEDIDTGLSAYADKSFDYVILNQTFQQVKKPDFVLKEALRVGKRTIVGFPNFVYISARFQMLFGGKVPVTPSLPYEWYDTPNLHFLSIEDFKEYCRKREIRIEQVGIHREKQESKPFSELVRGNRAFLVVQIEWNPCSNHRVFKLFSGFHSNSERSFSVCLMMY